MGGQVNVRLGDEDDAALTRCAAERGVERATLAKSFVRECLDAWREGRAVFDRPELPGPGDVVALGTRLDKAVMEVDRIAQAWAAHESKMHKLERQDQLAMTQARSEFIKGMPERITASLNPIRAEMLLLAERIDRQPRLDAIDEGQRAHTTALQENTAERDVTLLLTAGRAMRSEANQAVQAELKASGEIAATGTPFTVLDRVNATREGARLMRAYRPGHVVEVRTNLPSQGLMRGDRGVVTGVDGDRVRLGMADGTEKLFRPGRLAKNLDRDAVSVFALKQVELHVGDRIRWSDNDPTRGLDNGSMARVEEVGRGRLVVSSRIDGTMHEIASGDRMAERLDLAYAINVHVAQGVTTEHGIVAMRSSERKLLTERSFLVALTRVADNVALVLDDGRKVERHVTRNTGDKTSALDVVGRGQATDAIRLPDAGSPLDLALERYAQLFLAAERMREDGREMPSSQMRDLDAASAALDRVRPYASEDLRIVLDRSADPARALQQAFPGKLRQVWAEETQARTDPRVYADRFVADWRSASGDRGAAETPQVEDRAERRLERLEDRMARQPALEKTLDARIPERQLGLDGPGMGGGGRERDYGMEI